MLLLLLLLHAECDPKPIRGPGVGCCCWKCYWACAGYWCLPGRRDGTGAGTTGMAATNSWSGYEEHGASGPRSVGYEVRDRLGVGRGCCTYVACRTSAVARPAAAKRPRWGRARAGLCARARGGGGGTASPRGAATGLA